MVARPQEAPEGTDTIEGFAERWMSGLSHTPGKRAWGYTHRGFESRPFRQRDSKDAPSGAFLFLHTGARQDSCRLVHAANG